jgi:hypothetical protein
MEGLRLALVANCNQESQFARLSLRILTPLARKLEASARQGRRVTFAQVRRR